jgi:hypothetical protein
MLRHLPSDLLLLDKAGAFQAPALWSADQANVVRGMRAIHNLRQSFPVFIFINSAYVPMTISWLCNIALVTAGSDVMQHIAVVCADAECLAALASHPVAGQASILSVAEELDSMHLHERFLVAPANAAAAKQVGDLQLATTKFVLVTLMRVLLVEAASRGNIPYLLMESDSFWFMDAHKYITEHYLDSTSSWSKQPHHLVWYRDMPGKGDKGGGAGMFLVTTSDHAKQVMRKYVEQWVSRLGSYVGGGANPDQGIASALLYPEITSKAAKWFDPSLFPIGGDFFGLRSPAGWSSKGTVIAQNNYISGNSNKMQRAQKYGLWFIGEQLQCVIPSSFFKRAGLPEIDMPAQQLDGFVACAPPVLARSPRASPLRGTLAHKEVLGLKQLPTTWFWVPVSFLNMVPLLSLIILLICFFVRRRYVVKKNSA